MPNEFVARNGIIALANSTVTGSVTATQGFTGSLFGTSSWANNAATSSFILNAVSASFAATASSADNFLVRGTLTAQTIVAQVITSSTDFVTGSTRFGTLLTNTHVFSGSVTMNPGGLFVSGSGDVSIGTTTPFSTGGTAKVSVFAATTPALSIGIANNDLMYFRRESTGVFTLQTNNGGNAGNILLQPFGGNVGIGTTSPARALHVLSGVGTAQIQSSGTTSHMYFGDVNSSVIDNQGIGSVGNNLWFSAGGLERLRITSGGNVGIGTTSPSARLDIETSSGGYAVVIKNTSAGGDYLKMTGDSGNTAFEFGSGGTGADAFLNMYADNTQKVLVNADGTSYFNGGNVGIGTVTPLGNLQIGDSAGTGGTAALFNGFTGVSHGSLKIYAYGNNTPTIQLSANSSGIGGGTTYFNSGNVGIGTTSPTHQLSVYNVSRDSTTALNAGNSNIIPAISIQSGTGSWASTGNGFAYYYNTANGNLDLYRKDNSTTENHVMTWVRASGNVGIGTTAPAASLHIEKASQDNILAVIGQSGYEGALFLSAAGSGKDANIVVGNGRNLEFHTTSSATPVVGGTAQMTLTATGNLGIGTTSPTGKLHVSQSGNGAITTLILSDNARQLKLGRDQIQAYDLSDNATTLYISPNANIYMNNSSGITYFGGSVGIGTTSPNEKLHVAGNINAYAAGGIDAGLFASTAAGSTTIAIRSNGVTHFNGGNVGIGTTNPDVFARSYNGRILGISSLGQSAIELNGAAGSAAYIDMGVNGTRYLGLYSDASSSDISTIGAYPLTFGTNSTTRMVITSGGNVGIGTTSPSQKLHIMSGSVLAEGGGTNNGVIIGSHTNNVGGAIYGKGITNQIMYFDSTNTILNGESNIYFRIANSDKVIINSSGNVGIGTTSPAAKLDVSGDIFGRGVIFGYASSTQYGGLSYGLLGSTDGFLFLKTGGTTTVQLQASGSSYFNAGNVGIGSTSPGAKLDVTGNVRATSFTGSFTGSLTGLASNATTASYVLNAVSASFATFATTATSATTATAVVATVTGTNSTELVRGNMADNDQFRILVGGTAGNAGFVEIATADDGTEPIHVRQYSGTFGSIVRTATLLDGSGNTSFPGNVGIGTTTPTARLHVSGTTGGVFEVDGAAAVNALYVSASGRIGIGNITPGYTLDVTGNIHSTTTMLIDASNAAYLRGGDDHEWWDINVANTVGLYGTSNSAVGAIKLGSGGPTLYGASGNLGIGTTSPSGRLTTAESVNSGTANVLYLSNPSQTGTTAASLNFINADSTIKSSIIAAVFGNDYMTFNVGSNTERMRINASGNVGIGTTSPAYKLEVNGATGISGQTAITSDSTEQITIRTLTNTNRQLLIGYNYTPNYGYIQAVEQGTAFRNLLLNPSGGNVGIGTTSPSQKLNVFGNIRVDGDYVQIVNASSPSLYLNNVSVQWRAYMPTGLNNFAINDSARDVLTLGYNGGNSYFQGCNVGIGTTSPGYPLEIASTNALSIAYQRTGVSAKKWGFQSDNDSTYWYNITDNVLALTVRNTGLIGIGTTSPGEKLHVVGNIKLNNGNAIYLGDSANNNGGRIYVDTGTNNFYINQANNAPLYFATNNGTKATILGNGNFGIGTTNPSYKLHITETTSADCRLQIENTSTGNAGIEIVGGGGNQYIDFTPVASTDFEGRIIYSSSSDEMQFMTNGVNRFKLNNNGAEVQNGALGVGVAANSTDGRIDASNDIVAYSSDKRLKTNIQSIENPLDKIGKLNGFTYNWNDKAAKLANYDTNESLIGVFAQEVQAVLPEAVKLAPFDNDGNNKSISGENYLTVQYEKIVPLLIEAIKEQQKQIDDLKYLLSQK